MFLKTVLLVTFFVFSTSSFAAQPKQEVLIKLNQPGYVSEWNVTIYEYLYGKKVCLEGIDYTTQSKRIINEQGIRCWSAANAPAKLKALVDVMSW
jgi:hypothetical protein